MKAVGTLGDLHQRSNRVHLQCSSGRGQNSVRGDVERNDGHVKIDEVHANVQNDQVFLKYQKNARGATSE